MTLLAKRALLINSLPKPIALSGSELHIKNYLS